VTRRDLRMRRGTLLDRPRFGCANVEIRMTNDKAGKLSLAAIEKAGLVAADMAKELGKTL